MGLDDKEIKFGAKGLEARVIQHEIDHLNGILFVDHLKNLDELYTYEIKEKEWILLNIKLFLWGHQSLLSHHLKV